MFLFFFWPPGMWDLSAPGPGIKPTCPALEDEVLTTGPPGNPWTEVIYSCSYPS